MSEEVMPFRVEIGENEVADLRARLERTRWPEAETVDDWSQGVPLEYARELCEYWCGSYDMSRVATRLNAFPQFRTDVDGLAIHFLHVRSPHEDATPLIVSHGWPGSVLEFVECIDALTDPTAHGGEAQDAFHLVLPSLPGYGFSGRPQSPGWGAQRTARAWSALMGRLGYERYAAQGGDWGAVITTALGHQDPDRLLGIHLNLARAAADALGALELTDQEQQDVARIQHFRAVEMGYYALQSTRPQTLGYGLADSPAAQLTWIVEKMRQWTDCNGHPENAVSRDEMLDNVMIYWLTDSGASSARMYWEAGADPWGELTPTAVPVAYSVFPHETSRFSERWARTRYPDLAYYNRTSAGGHFAALEQPRMFVDEVRAGFRAIRAGGA